MKTNVIVSIVTCIMMVSSSVALASNDLMLVLGGTKDVLGGRFPTSTLVRFDSANEKEFRYDPVLSDLFFVSAIDVTDNGLAFLPGSMGVVESVDVASGKGSFLGPLATNLGGVILDVESGNNDELLVVASSIADLQPGRVTVFDETGHRIRDISASGYKITNVTSHPSGDTLFFDRLTLTIFRAGSTREQKPWISSLNKDVTDMQIDSDGSLFLATAISPYGDGLLQQFGSFVEKFTPDGQYAGTVFSAIGHLGCDDCTPDEASISSIVVNPDGTLYVGYNENTKGPTVGHLVKLTGDGSVLADWTVPDAAITAMSRIPEYRKGPTLNINVVSESADLNSDGLLNVGDLDRRSQAIRANETQTGFDLDSNGILNHADRTFFVRVVARTFFGDSNLDGIFDSSDFVRVFQSGEYEDSIPGNSTWSTGDWDGDGDFSATDFILAFQSGGYYLDSVEVAAAVPEPSLPVMAVSGVLLFICVNSRQLWTQGSVHHDRQRVK